MNPIGILEEFYFPDSLSHEIIMRHGKQVAQKALEIAENVVFLDPDINFVKEAAMLHDIGIFMTNVPEIGCIGKYPYICHGYLGREILEKKRLLKHALVSERHVGVGITAEEIRRKHLPLPVRDMVPVSIEEKIICYADKFFSKYPDSKEKSIEEVINLVSHYGQDQVERFESWIRLFGKHR